MTALNQATLGSLSISVPSYNRSQLKIGIVHFGVGGFHRAHQAMYVDQLMEQGTALNWQFAASG
jgi:mannitol 2-dehydrogenase